MKEPFSGIFVVVYKVFDGVYICTSVLGAMLAEKSLILFGFAKLPFLWTRGITVMHLLHVVVGTGQKCYKRL